MASAVALSDESRADAKSEDVSEKPLAVLVFLFTELEWACAVLDRGGRDSARAVGDRAAPCHAASPDAGLLRMERKSLLNMEAILAFGAHLLRIHFGFPHICNIIENIPLDLGLGRRILLLSHPRSRKAAPGGTSFQ
jgi:hypothetical protein